MPTDLPTCPRCHEPVIDAGGLVWCSSTICLYGIDMKVTVEEHRAGEPGHTREAPKS
jgi:hypothetical protein